MGNGNFKVKCIKSMAGFIAGDIYEVINGKLIDKDGDERPMDSIRINAFEDIEKCWEGNHFIPIITNQTIIIYRKDREVIANLKEGNKVIKSAKARCCSTDTFNFEVGAKLAVSRLLGISVDGNGTEKVVKTDDNFKAKCTRTIDASLTVGKIYEFKDGFSKWDTGEKMPQFTKNGIGRFKDFSDLQKWFGTGKTDSLFEEIKEDSATAPAIRIVKQKKYEVGDKVKVRADLRYGEYYPKASVVESMLKYAGQFVTIKRMYQPNDNFYINEDNGAWCWTPEMFEGKVIENTVVAPVAPSFDWSAFKSGKFAVHCDTEEKAKEFLKECDVQGIKWGVTGKLASEFCVGATGYCCFNGEAKLSHCPKDFYEEKGLKVVTYIPSKPTVKEIKRHAKAGEWIKVVNAFHLSRHRKNPEYSNGDVMLVNHVDGYDVYIENIAEYLQPSEYVVLENYQPETAPVDSKPEEPKPFVKAKVGDKIKIVGDIGGHGPAINIGDIQTVADVRSYNVGTDIGNVFYDRHQEYIIIEEASTIKSQPIEIGDTVKVIGTGSVCTTYRDFIKKYAKDFYSKYNYGYDTRRGSIGVVVGKGMHEHYGKEFFAVLADGRAFCIGARDIEKVRS